jgi:hypothetical protein
VVVKYNRWRGFLRGIPYLRRRLKCSWWQAICVSWGMAALWATVTRGMTEADQAELHGWIASEREALRKAGHE